MAKNGIRNRRTSIIDLIPTIGIILFLLLFIYAASLYPGGSQLDSSTAGFDWFNNYWCNLLNKKSINGKINPARPYAISGMILLCLGIIYFFFQYAKVLATNKYRSKMIIIAGTLSMLTAMFMFSQWHDQITIISSVFGVVAVLGIIIELYKSQQWIWKASGLICLFLLGGNNIIYYSEIGIHLLPLIQKVTLAMTLLWISSLNIKMTNA